MTTKLTAPKKDAAKSLSDLFEDCLKDALWAENAMKDSLPKMIKNVTSKELKKALEEHLTETKEHIKQIKAVFKSIGLKAEEERCDAMAGILEEGEGIIEGTEPGAVRDAGIIAACQKAEHYEIASYGTMYAYARHLKHTEAKNILADILKQEKAADKLMTKLAISEINVRANTADKESKKSAVPKASAKKATASKTATKTPIKKSSSSTSKAKSKNSSVKESKVSSTKTSGAKSTSDAASTSKKTASTSKKPTSTNAKSSSARPSARR